MNLKQVMRQKMINLSLLTKFNKTQMMLANVRVISVVVNMMNSTNFNPNLRI
uniref:Uncharacterized protein n=1 Tax=Solanum tuberosum TaxID=4113 RepID=M1A7X8_SOLTU